ncbi:calcium-binding protein [Mesorhizobium sp. 1B3]|uniref:calcium-binding protein n=1 Tax=Mesorhizobium sp. 1B3 TaxID=3243599 RepID=UPI003D99B969
MNVLNGGDGNDVLDASARGRSISTELVSNSLHGGRGDDVLRAFNFTNSDFGTPVGINELWGDDGSDVLEATHSASFNGVTDVTNRLDGGKGDDSLNADITGNGGSVRALNRLDGGDGQDTLIARLDVVAIGGAPVRPLYDVANVLNGGSGNDHLEAFLSIGRPDVTGTSPVENRLDGGSGHDTLVATVAPGTVPGSSFLNGGSGNDRLTVFGGSGNVLNGGDGNDTLVGGIGDDDLMGEDGADRFVFAPQSGHDTVDFEKGQDILDFRALAATVSSFADLDIDVIGQDSVIHFDTDDDLTVLGVTDLSESDFLFA